MLKKPLGGDILKMTKNIVKFWNASIVTCVKNGSLLPFESLPYIAIRTSATIDAAFAGSGIAKGSTSQ